MASETTTAPGAAMVCSRAARFVVSPIAVYSMRRSLPMRPTTTRPVWMPMRTRTSTPEVSRSSSRQRPSARWIASPDCTARRGASSSASGAPNTAITPSPVNCTTVPS